MNQLTGNEPMNELTIKQFLTANIFATLLINYGTSKAGDIGLAAIVDESHYTANEMIREFNRQGV
ncbi:hypothetical protein H9X96_17440 [Pedobacter sp. N36a]|uniref:hypothetical protein n=1 Tax=Pedobacter sp. N36a TaxID=2767996 RepID=UPI0016575365|nr:hypothetical protein [Pedobacter sp. N36a]MBC8987556.1 hypothetical protein [Pedobacter sp. N36a]